MASNFPPDSGDPSDDLAELHGVDEPFEEVFPDVTDWTSDDEGHIFNEGFVEGLGEECEPATCKEQTDPAPLYDNASITVPECLLPLWLTSTVIK